MRRIRFAFLVVFLLPLCAYAQQYPFYSQYIYNPFVINPAFVASGRQMEVNATYRRQWANIEDGPKTLQFDIQYPINPRMALGVNVFEDRTVLLSSTTAMLTYGYKVPLATDHVLGFGLSGGMISNRIRASDIASIDASDPSLFTNNNMSVDGQFGAYYNFRNLYLGFSLIRLFDTRVISEDAFQQLKLSKLENKVVYASYRFNFGAGTFAFQPNFMYRFAMADVNFYEATGLISYNNMVDVGGGFREGFGPILMGRLRVKNLEAGFAYDFPSALPQVSTGGTYEVQLKYKFGRTVDAPAKRSRPQIVATVTPPDTTRTRPTREEPKVEPKVETVQEPAKQDPPVQQTQPVVEEAKTPPVVFHLVIGAYRDPQHAQDFLRSVRQKGYKAEIKPAKGFTYVYLTDHTTETMDAELILKIRATTPFKDAWYTKLEE